MAVVKRPSTCSSSAPRKKPKRDVSWYSLVKRRKCACKKKNFSHDIKPKRDVISLLGKGTFGSVFLAESNDKDSPHLPPQFAVKSAAIDDSSSSSLKYEKQILTELGSSPHVVGFYGDEVTYMKDGTQVYNLLLEFCSGLSLDHRIRQSHSGRLSDSDVRYYATDILQGLNYIHSLGYVHCDIKPCNILLVDGSGERSGTSVAKLADFGLAMTVDGEKASCLRGTYRYMSPEHVRDKILDYPVDIWAFGCSVVEMMTGKPAWDYSEVEDLLCVIGKSDELPNIPCNASEEAKDFLSRCLDRDPSLRWSAQMLLQHPFLSM